MNAFLNCVLHFVDIKVCPNVFDIYCRNIQTGQNTDIEAFILRKWKTSQITSLTIRAKRICSRNNLNKDIDLIKDYAAWNGFPKRIANSIIKRALQTNDSSTIISEKTNEDSMKIFFNLNYSGETAVKIVASCVRKLYRRLNDKLFLSLSCTTSFFANTKDKTVSLIHSSVLHNSPYFGFSCTYTDKTERTLHE